MMPPLIRIFEGSGSFPLKAAGQAEWIMVSLQAGACLKALGIVTKKQTCPRNLFTITNVDGHLTYRYRVHYLFFRYGALCMSL